MADIADGENPAYLSEQIITYLGNKRALLSFIGAAADTVRSELRQDKLVTFDVFSGSGIVARFFKRFSSRLYANDLEPYSELENRCYLTNRGDVNEEELSSILADLKVRIEKNLHGGFITGLYAPADERNIRPGERVFYTVRNAMYIDTARQEIEKLPEDLRRFFLAPLLYGASVHSNTSGVFKGFYKDKAGLGQYGGAGRNALSRILGNIELRLPVFSDFECDCGIFRLDAALAAREIPEEVDLAYLDPPYNQHPYGSNYFMLNLILDYRRPVSVSPVSGIPDDWNHSPYNRRRDAKKALFDLVAALRARYVLISYNSEGFVGYDEFVDYLSSLGRLSVMDKKYNTFRGCRNLGSRDAYVKEFLFLLKKC